MGNAVAGITGAIVGDGQHANARNGRTSSAANPAADYSTGNIDPAEVGGETIISPMEASANNSQAAELSTNPSAPSIPTHLEKRDEIDHKKSREVKVNSDENVNFSAHVASVNNSIDPTSNENIDAAKEKDAADKERSREVNNESIHSSVYKSESTTSNRTEYKLALKLLNQHASSILNTKSSNATTTLMKKSDAKLLPDYHYHLLMQLVPCHLTKDDLKVGTRTQFQPGYCGLQCLYCINDESGGRQFYTTSCKLLKANSEIPKHLLRDCNHCPVEVREALEVLKAESRVQFKSRGQEKFSQFYEDFWKRMRAFDLDDSDEKNSLSCDDDDEATVDTHSDGSSSESEGVASESPATPRHQKEKDKNQQHESTTNLRSRKPAAVSKPSPGSPMIGKSLMRNSDAKLLSDYQFHIMSQLVVCQFTDENRTKARGLQNGYCGVQCAHCKESRQYFVTTSQSLRSYAMQFIPSHIESCEKCPKHVKDKLEEFKDHHGEQMKKLKFGSAGKFFQDFWGRLRACDNGGSIHANNLGDANASNDSDEESPTSELGNESDEIDCFFCNDGGDLICCDYCTKVYHLQCHAPKLASVPAGKFKCCECKAGVPTIGDEVYAATVTDDGNGKCKMIWSHGVIGLHFMKQEKNRKNLCRFYGIMFDDGDVVDSLQDFFVMSVDEYKKTNGVSLFELGDEVLAPWWRKRKARIGQPSWHSAIVATRKFLNKKNRENADDKYLYSVKFDNGDELENIKGSLIFRKRYRCGEKETNQLRLSPEKLASNHVLGVDSDDVKQSSCGKNVDNIGTESLMDEDSIQTEEDAKVPENVSAKKLRKESNQAKRKPAEEIIVSRKSQKISRHGKNSHYDETSSAVASLRNVSTLGHENDSISLPTPKSHRSALQYETKVNGTLQLIDLFDDIQARFDSSVEYGDEYGKSFYGHIIKWFGCKMSRQDVDVGDLNCKIDQLIKQFEIAKDKLVENIEKYGENHFACNARKNLLARMIDDCEKEFSVASGANADANGSS